MSTDEIEGDTGEPNLEDLLSLRQAAKQSGLSHSHLRLLIRSGEIWGKKIGRDWFTTSAAVRDYLARERRPGPKPKKAS